MRHYIMLLGIALAPSIATAQHGGGAQAPLNTAPPREAAQFDFLVGEWQLDVRPVINTLAAKIHGSPKFTGTWKAWRAFDGFGIEDEHRISDNSGNPRALSHAMRVYDAPSARWKSSLLDVYRGTFTTSTGEWKQGEMVVTSRGVDGAGDAYVTRSHFRDITASSFTYVQERSTDEGRTWTENLRIIARRTAGAGAAATAPR